MGFINIMKQQENPDGVSGHEGREQFQEESKQFPRKKKFTGGRKAYVSAPVITSSMQRALDNEHMKKNCAYWSGWCKITECSPVCKRLIAAKKNEKQREKSLGLVLVRARRKEDRDRDLKRQDYWLSEIAFECPVTGVQHTVLDCLNSCDKWGRRFQPDKNGEPVMVLHCCADRDGEREIQSGEPTVT